MKRYWTFAIALMAVFLLLFLLVEALEIPLLTDPSKWLAGGGVAAAAIGVGLLVADIVLPVPSSIVMIAHGALFGALLGATLSLAGMLGAAMTGFAIGRRGGPLAQRLVPEVERQRADRMIERWGALALVVTRPVPILAESCAILAGASSLSWTKALLASLIGSLPPALLYALTGSMSASFRSGALMFLFILVVSGLFWLISCRARRPVIRPEMVDKTAATETAQD